MENFTCYVAFTIKNLAKLKSSFVFSLVFIMSFAPHRIDAQDKFKLNNAKQANLNYFDYHEHDIAINPNGDLEWLRPFNRTQRTVTTLDLNGAFPGTDLSINAIINFIYQPAALDWVVTTSSGSFTNATSFDSASTLQQAA